MQTSLFLCRDQAWSLHSQSAHIDTDAFDLVLAFGSRHLLQESWVYPDLKSRFPNAHIAICSTAGEIYNTEVYDDSLSVAAIQFDHTGIRTESIQIEDYADSFEAGKALLDKFPKEGLAYLLVLSDGSKVNGSELVKAFNTYADKLLITGGLAGDGNRFESSVVGLDAAPSEGVIAGIGFYGDKLVVRHGSKGGWEMFGLEKTVTRSAHNILYEIDGRSALELYKRYLGPDAAQLPGSALLFPLSVTLPDSGENVVRTILSIDEEAGSMTFAGDIPEGSQVRFMRANFDKISHAASDAAMQSWHESEATPSLALLISCVGRKLILGPRTEDEVDAVAEVFRHQTLLSGFYSYGEISPLVAGGRCQLHNQTMTITTFHEAQ